MKCLITGSDGFVAQHLTRLLTEQGHSVFGFDVKRGDDIRDYERVRIVVDQVAPDRIYHLAALADVPESFANPHRAIDINTKGSLNILEAVRQLSLRTRILMAGTSEEYGDASDEDGIITEKTLLSPRSPYSVAKMAMDYLGQVYASTYGIPIVVTRAFNHSGPGRHERYAETAFAKQIAEIELGRRKVLEHGSLDSVRNFSDVRDVVRAYTMAIELDPDVYNICADDNVSMQKILDTLIASATCEIPTRINPQFVRKADYSFKKPSCEKFRGLTGWAPEIPLEKTLADTLEDWRRRVT